MNGVCRRCGKRGFVHVHHVYGGSYRKTSDLLGLTVDLCPECHEYIHSSKGTEERRQLQHDEQQAYMDKMGWDVNQWIYVWGKSWL